MVLAVALKVTEVAPAATVTEVGVVTSALLSDTATTVPPAGATLVRVTVHVLVAPEPRLVGLQASDERATGATRLSVTVCETPLRVAVTVAV